MLHVQLHAHINELVQRDVVDLLVGAAHVDGNCSVLRFLVTQDQNVGILVVLELLDLLLHVVVGVIGLNTDAQCFESLHYLLRIVIVLSADRDYSDLIRGHPEGEYALEVLDDNTEETLDGSEDRAVNDDRYLLRTILSGVLEVKVSGKLEVELDRAALPLSSERVLDLQVDLGAVESAVAFVDLVAALAVFLVKDLLQNCFRVVPELDIAIWPIFSFG